MKIRLYVYEQTGGHPSSRQRPMHFEIGLAMGDRISYEIIVSASGLKADEVVYVTRNDARWPEILPNMDFRPGETCEAFEGQSFDVRRKGVHPLPPHVLAIDHEHLIARLVIDDSHPTNAGKKIEGILVEKYMENPVLTVGFSHTEPPIGACLATPVLEDGYWIADFGFSEDTDLAQRSWRLLLSGELVPCIGVETLEYDHETETIRKCRLNHVTLVKRETMKPLGPRASALKAHGDLLADVAAMREALTKTSAPSTYFVMLRGEAPLQSEVARLTYDNEMLIKHLNGAGDAMQAVIDAEIQPLRVRVAELKAFIERNAMRASDNGTRGGICIECGGSTHDDSCALLTLLGRSP